MSGADVPPEPPGEYHVRREPGVRSLPYPQVEIIVTATADQLAAALTTPSDTDGGREHDPPGGPPGGPGRAEGFARAHHGVPVHPRTLRLLACSGRLRRVLYDDRGAVLGLGRAARYASPAQKRALLARDVGCIIPGCGVPGGDCDVHHPTPWAAGGRTDLENLALLCPRHHTEVHDDKTWQIHMIDGVPWVRPPAWAHSSKPLLRNTTYRPSRGAA